MEKNDLNYWQSQFEAHFKDVVFTDASHDICHFRRVWKVASQLMAEESRECDPLVVMAACYFHDLVSYPKNHPNRSLSSLHASQQVVPILRDMGFDERLLPAVQHAIHAHSFSANVACESVEAEIVQDADRMESIGAIGLARVFYTSGQLGSQLFDGHDPWAQQRTLDDKTYAIDHFPIKLLTLSGTMKTAAGKAMAQRASAYLEDFLARLKDELEGIYR